MGATTFWHPEGSAALSWPASPVGRFPAMRHAIAPPVELTLAKQLPGRFIRITSAKALAAWRDRGVRSSQEWQARPDLKGQRDEKFFSGAASHNRWPTLAQFTCCAVVRSKRCNRISISKFGLF